MLAVREGNAAGIMILVRQLGEAMASGLMAEYPAGLHKAVIHLREIGHGGAACIIMALPGPGVKEVTCSA